MKIKLKSLLALMQIVLCVFCVAPSVYSVKKRVSKSAKRPVLGRNISDILRGGKIVSSQQSILHVAVKRDPNDTIRWLIENAHLDPRRDDIIPTIVATPHAVRNPIVNALDSKGATALHYAALRGRYTVVQMLIENGAMLDVQDHLGNTPLHYAAFSNHISTVCLLCDFGANLKLVNKDGLTPLDCAKASKRQRVVFILSRYLQS